MSGLQVLLVDDQAQDRELVRREFEKHFPEVEFMEVSRREELDRALERDRFDVAISDYALGWGDGLKVLDTVLERWPGCGRIMYTGTGNEEVAVEAMKKGLDDYLVKSRQHVRLLPDVARRAIEGRTRSKAVHRTGSEFRTHLDHLPAGVFRLGPEGDLTYANRAFTEMLGFRDATSLLGIRLVDLAVDRSAGERLLDSRGPAEPFSIEDIQLRRRDGVARWFRVERHMIGSTDSSRPQVEGVVHDIQEWRDAEDVARHQAELLGLLHSIATAANGAATLTEALEVVLPELCAGTGCPVAHAWTPVPGGRGDLQSSGTWCLLDPTSSDAFRRVTAKLRFKADDELPGRAIAAGRAMWIDDFSALADSPRRAAAAPGGIGAAVAVPVVRKGEVVAVVELFLRRPSPVEPDLLTLLDRAAQALAQVAEREWAEDRVADVQSRATMSQKMEAIARLAGGVAHEFNNLLTVITLEAEGALGDPDVTPAVRTALGSITHTADRASQLARRLLTFGRRRPGNLGSVDLGEVVLDMSHYLERLVGDDVNLLARIEADGIGVTADRSQLEQVITNLVLNARDALPNGGEINVGVRRVAAHEIDPWGPEKRGQYVGLTVHDNGHRIPAGIRDRIFEPFFSTRGHGPGAGLGLAICHGVVEELGGRIRVESSQDEGTTIEILLPTAAVRVPSERPPSERAPYAASARGDESVLIVQDEEDLRPLLTRMLKAEGYRVTDVSRGEEALEMLEMGRSFDVVVTDLGLPGIQGPEVAARIRSLSPETIIVMTTGYSDLALESDKAAAFGADHIIHKPFSLDSFLGTLRRILEERRPAEK